MALKKGPDDKIWDNYKPERNKLKAMIQRAKRESWKKFTSETSNVEEMANLTKAIFGKEVKKIGHLRKPDGSLTRSWGEILNMFKNGLFLPTIKTPQGS